MADTPFVHLHCHTDYSLLDGACEISQLMDTVAAQKMPAVAMTDHGNLFGAVQFYNTAKAKGIHPVIGCEVYVSQQGHKTRSDSDRYNHLVLLCENQEGYRNLIDLVSTAYLEGFYYKPRIDKELLAAHSKGLIAMSACLRGDINETILADRYDEARRLAYTYQDIFGRGNFFLEIQDHGLEQDKRVTPQVNRLSSETGIPLVATNDAHYLHRDDARAHEILMCIQTGKTMTDPARMHWDHPDFYLKSRAEMMAAVRRAGRSRRPHLGDRAALPGEAGKDQGAVPALRRAGRAHDRHLFRIRGAAGIREAAAAPGSAARAGPVEARSGGVRRAAGSRNPHDPADEVLRLLPDRLGLHPLREIAFDSGGAGARLGGRQPGQLRHGDHRYRSAAVRAAVRALPESGAHQHAGYRYRLLHEPARRSDSIRHRKIRTRAGGADHHVQHAGRARGDQGRGARAGHELRRRGAHHQAGAQRAEHLAGRCHQGGARLRRAGAQGPARGRDSARSRGGWRVWRATARCMRPAW